MCKSSKIRIVLLFVAVELIIHQFLPIFFILIWLDEFGCICQKYESDNIMGHVRKCLDIYYSLQSGLGLKKRKYINTIFQCFTGLSFVVIFSVFQVSTITCLFMIVNSPYSTVFTINWQKYSMMLCYFMFSVYYASTMYCITITAENASNNLKYLAKELRLKLGKYTFFYLHMYLYL